MGDTKEKNEWIRDEIDGSCLDFGNNSVCVLMIGWGGRVVNLNNIEVGKCCSKRKDK